MEKHVLGIDIGTTSVKAVLFGQNGVCVEESEVTYELLHPQRGMAEQDPYEIEKAALEALRLLPSDKYAVSSAGFSAAMHTLICLDEKGEPLTNSITWADTRSSEEAKMLLESAEGSGIYERTGTPIHTMSPLTKLHWLKKHRADLYRKTKKFVSIKEFLFYRWFGAEVVDYSIASATGLFDVHNKHWDKRVLASLDITNNRLNEPVPPAYVLPELKDNIRTAAGLPEGIVFAAGGSDGALANLGIGALNPGETALTIGTSGAVRQMSSTPAVSKNQRTFCYAFDEEAWIVGGPTNNGGIAFQWLQKIFKNNNIEQLLEDASQVQPESSSLLFLPYLQGERAPVWDPGARGGFINLSIEHDQKHLTRAVLEGVIFSVYDVFNSVEETAGPTKQLFVSGGFARSPLWLQITADVFGRELLIPASHQSSAWGAAWCSMIASGEKTSYQEIKECIPMKEPIYPNKHNHAVYQKLFTKYRGLYEALKPFQ